MVLLVNLSSMFRITSKPSSSDIVAEQVVREFLNLFHAIEAATEPNHSTAQVWWENINNFYLIWTFPKRRDKRGILAASPEFAKGERETKLRVDFEGW